MWKSVTLYVPYFSRKSNTCIFKTWIKARCKMVLMAMYQTHQKHHINALRPRPNRRHVADDIFKCIFLNENVWIPIKISLKFVPKGPINNIPALVQIMAWCHSGDKPLSEPMMVNLPTHICVTRPQWVKPSLSKMTHYFIKNIDSPQAFVQKQQPGSQTVSEFHIVNIYKHIHHVLLFIDIDNCCYLLVSEYRIPVCFALRVYEIMVFRRFQGEE